MHIVEENFFKFITKKVTILIMCLISFQLGIYENQTFHLESNRNKINNEFFIITSSIFFFNSSVNNKSSISSYILPSFMVRSFILNDDSSFNLKNSVMVLVFPILRTTWCLICVSLEHLSNAREGILD